MTNDLPSILQRGKELAEARKKENCADLQERMKRTADYVDFAVEHFETLAAEVERLRAERDMALAQLESLHASYKDAVDRLAPQDAPILTLGGVMRGGVKRRKVIAIAPIPEPKTVAQAYADSLPPRPELSFPRDDGPDELIAFVTHKGSLQITAFYPSILTPTGAIALAHWILATFEKKDPPAREPAGES